MCDGCLLQDWGSAFPREAEMEMGKDWFTHRLWAGTVTQSRGPRQGCPPAAQLSSERWQGRTREHTACISFSCCTRRTSPRRGSCAESSSSFCPSQSMISWRGTCSFPLWSEKASSRALAGEQGEQDGDQTDKRGTGSPGRGGTALQHPQNPISDWKHTSARAVHDPQPAQMPYCQVG